MDFDTFFKTVKEACENSPALVILAVLAVVISIFLIIDAHRHKKKHPRHRWK